MAKDALLRQPSDPIGVVEDGMEASDHATSVVECACDGREAVGAEGVR